jgi:hypothetical protein
VVLSIALVEYFGKFPGLSQHGNGKEGTEYIRTPASVMTEMSDMLKCEKLTDDGCQVMEKAHIAFGKVS